MTGNVIVSTIVVAVFAAIVAAALALAPSGADPAEADEPGTSTGRLVRDHSHRLGERGDDTVVHVEFLQFECQSCPAA